jgi:tRNA G18 (ribose-2'-O)-methylase SpoU
MRKLRTIEMKRLSVEEYHEAEKTPLIVILDDVRSMHNVGSVFRTADAFRLEAVYLCGITGCPPHAEIHKTALGAEDAVQWRYFATADEAVEELHREGCFVYSVEQVENSTKLNQLTKDNSQLTIDNGQLRGKAIDGNSIAVVFGNEVKGVHQSVVDASDGCLEIPQFGTKHSMNVSVTAGIVIWEFARTMNFF